MMGVLRTLLKIIGTLSLSFHVKGKEFKRLVRFLRAHRKKGISFFFLLPFLWSFISLSHAADSKPSWQTEWERTVKAAEAEGQLTV